ncbi:hypothetical protein [Acidiphilium iwatense]|uniref:hypothetical protein n=1 Tax=Acidiphilium iwatense TaxID=768198 RepID=UPI001F376983|nr:hypothetical protein [Acidiphilium iwatense]
MLVEIASVASCDMRDARSAHSAIVQSLIATRSIANLLPFSVINSMARFMLKILCANGNCRDFAFRIADTATVLQ